MDFHFRHSDSSGKAIDRTPKLFKNSDLIVFWRVHHVVCYFGLVCKMVVKRGRRMPTGCFHTKKGHVAKICIIYYGCGLICCLNSFLIRPWSNTYLKYFFKIVPQNTHTHTQGTLYIFFLGDLEHEIFGIMWRERWLMFFYPAFSMRIFRWFPLTQVCQRSCTSWCTKNWVGQVIIIILKCVEASFKEHFFAVSMAAFFLLLMIAQYRVGVE